MRLQDFSANSYSHAASARTAIRSYAVLGIATALYYYLHLFRLPFTPIWHMGDAAIFLSHAERMLHGEVLYRDIFQFNMPGTEFLYLALFRLLGVHFWIPNVVLLLVGTAVTLLVFRLARLVLSGAAAFLPPIAFLAVCQRGSIEPSHHWFSTFFVLLAVVLVARSQRLTSIAAAGFLLGFATLFTSTRGAFVVLGLALFFLWELRDLRKAFRPIAVLFAGFLLPPAISIGCLTAQVGGKVLYDSLVVFPLRYYPAGGANSFSVYFDEWQNLLPFHMRSLAFIALWFAVNLATPLLLIGFAACMLRGRAHVLPGADRGLLTLFTFAGVFALLAAAGAPSTPRLACAAAFAYILAVVWIERCAVRLARVLLVPLCLACAADSAFMLLRPTDVLYARRGVVAIIHKSSYETLAWLEQNAHPGDGYFGSQVVNWLNGLKNPGTVEWVEPNAYTRPEQVRDLIRGLDRCGRCFVESVDEESTPHNPQDKLDPLRAYLATHFHVVHTFSNGMPLLLNNSADPSPH